MSTMNNACTTADETILFRRHVGQISRHSSVFFAATMFSTAAAYFFKIYLARVLGAEALGIYALGMTVIGFFGIFNALGLPQAAVRFVAAYQATGRVESLRKFLWMGSGLLLAVNVLLSFVLLWLGPYIGLHLYHVPSLSRYLPLFAAIMVLGCLTTFFGQALAGYKDVRRRSIITTFIGTPFMMIGSVLLIARGAGLWGYIFAQVVSAVVVCGLLLASVWKLTPRQGYGSVNGAAVMGAEVMSFSAAALGVGVLEFVLAQADKVLIGFWLNAREVGIYAVAAGMVGLVPIALQSVNQIFSPIIADLHARGDRALLQRLFQTLTKWIVALTLPLGAVVSINAATLMRIFGPEFETGWPILVIGVVGQLINCGVGSVGYLLLMSGNQLRLIKVQAAMAVLMIALNASLIPVWGITGAAVGAAVVTIVANLWNLREVRVALGISPYNRSYLRIVPACTAAVFAILAVKTTMSGLRVEWKIGLSLMAGYSALWAGSWLAGLNGDDRIIADAAWLRLRAAIGHVAVTA
ncbi:MAG TPA: flippase [Terriglobales bacterium]|nr:flippase [Terriglobales bacterium]